MHHPFASLPLPVFLIAPPYERIAHAALYASGLPPGAVLAVEIRQPAGNRVALQALLPQLRVRHPAFPVVLLVRESARPDLPHLAQLAAQLRFRGVLVEDEPVRSSLRRSLTDPVDLAADVAEWFALRDPLLSPDLLHLIRQVFRCASDHAEITTLLRSAGTSERTARARLRKRGLPPPGSWLQAARALRAALRLQCDPPVPLLSLALELGYSDHSALSHQLGRVFGVGSSAIRELLGWEWLLDRWARREVKGRSAVTRAA